ncbi:hypothetical protein [Streptomyces lutosisoli]|uniref:Uncharacterized protein n=1 Tax=Streptomyces lutosisoli TaxID=2665721 RepID=A0ABW2VSB0_9ACTN
MKAAPTWVPHTLLRRVGSLNAGGVEAGQVRMKSVSWAMAGVTYSSLS